MLKYKNGKVFNTVTAHPHKKNTRGRFVTVEITVENVRNRRENSHGIDKRVLRILHVWINLFGRFVTGKKPCMEHVIGTAYRFIHGMGDVIGFRDNEYILTNSNYDIDGENCWQEI